MGTRAELPRTRTRRLPFSLLLITDERAAQEAGRGVVETVARALLPAAPGVAVLVRSKNRGRREVRALCEALRPIARRSGALLLVHTHVELVAELGLDGVHVAANAELRKTRARLHDRNLLGVSRHPGDALDDDALAPVDYVTLSPVFRPTSKPDDARPPLGLASLAAAASASARPIVALGGVRRGRVASCIQAGAAAVAVLGDAMAAHDPRSAAMDLLGEIHATEERPRLA